MLFTSKEFLIFFCVVFLCYHSAKRVVVQNILILLASCVFYAWWNWKFLFLMLGLSVSAYASALFIAQKPGPSKRLILTLTLTVVLACLIFFKYFYFLTETYAYLASFLGQKPSGVAFEIVLPIAISFHSFQLIAYVVDVYRGDYPPTTEFIDFMAFSFFFPQLIAGPIERASALLTQFTQPRSVSLRHLEEGFFLVAYGFFTKLALADSAAAIVNSVFVGNQASGWSVVMGTVLFGFQIYFDFLGYSLIAKGTALLLGFQLIWNFNLPYWAVSPADFWRRWHISLSRWLRDYLYIPLGGSRGSSLLTMRNLFATMTLGGLWHGASWNFVLWGVWHGLVLAVHRIFRRDDTDSRLSRIVGWFLTMLCVFIGWYFFRTTTMEVWHATTSALTNWELLPVHSLQLRAICIIGGILFCLEYSQRKGDNLLAYMRLGSLSRGVLTGVLAFLALCFHTKTHYSFIYFAF